MSTYTRKYCADAEGPFWPIIHMSAVRNANGDDVETLLNSMSSYEDTLGQMADAVTSYANTLGPQVDSVTSYANTLGGQVDTLASQLGFTYVQLSANLNNVVCPVELQNGQQHHVVYDNPTNTKYTVSVATSYTTPDGAAIELEVAEGGYGEINYLQLNGKVFVRAV